MNVLVSTRLASFWSQDGTLRRESRASSLVLLPSLPRHPLVYSVAERFQPARRGTHTIAKTPPFIMFTFVLSVRVHVLDLLRIFWFQYENAPTPSHHNKEAPTHFLLLYYSQVLRRSLFLYLTCYVCFYVSTKTPRHPPLAYSITEHSLQVTLKTNLLAELNHRAPN